MNEYFFYPRRNQVATVDAVIQGDGWHWRIQMTRPGHDEVYHAVVDPVVYPTAHEAAAAGFGTAIDEAEGLHEYLDSIDRYDLYPQEPSLDVELKVLPDERGGFSFRATCEEMSPDGGAVYRAQMVSVDIYPTRGKAFEVGILRARWFEARDRGMPEPEDVRIADQVVSRRN